MRVKAGRGDAAATAWILRGDAAATSWVPRWCRHIPRLAGREAAQLHRVVITIHKHRRCPGIVRFDSRGRRGRRFHQTASGEQLALLLCVDSRTVARLVLPRFVQNIVHQSVAAVPRLAGLARRREHEVVLGHADLARHVHIRRRRAVASSVRVSIYFSPRPVAFLLGAAEARHHLPRRRLPLLLLDLGRVRLPLRVGLVALGAALLRLPRARRPERELLLLRFGLLAVVV